MGKTFQKVRLCSVGKVQDADKIPRWVTVNGGEYTKIVDKRTTHLVTTKEAYKENVEAGDPFLANKKGAKGARGANRGRIYQEPGNGDIWKITLVRNHHPSNRQERYQLAIIQSFAKKPTYSAYAKYSRVGMSKVELLAPAQKNLPLAMKAFVDFFKGKTGKEWIDRDDGKLPSPKCNEDGEPLPPHEGWYAPERHSNIFTDYLKSWQESSGPNEFEAAVRDGIAVRPSRGLTINTNLTEAPDICTDQDGPFEGLSRSHALLESLMSREVGLSSSDTPKKEGCTDEGSL